MLKAEDFPRLGEAMVKIIRDAGGVLWLDRAKSLLAQQEGISYSDAARIAVYLTNDTQEIERIEYPRTAGVWYPWTIRLVGETSMVPLQRWVNPFNG